MHELVDHAFLQRLDLGMYGSSKLICPRVFGIALDSPLLQFWQVRSSS